VGADEDGLPGIAQGAERVPDALDGRGIEGRERLVDDEKIGREDKALQIGELLGVPGRVGCGAAPEQARIEDQAPRGVEDSGPERPEGAPLVRARRRIVQPSSQAKKAGRSGT
jgi:hypothetical protein